MLFPNRAMYRNWRQWADALTASLETFAAMNGQQSRIQRVGSKTFLWDASSAPQVIHTPKTNEVVHLLWAQWETLVEDHTIMLWSASTIGITELIPDIRFNSLGSRATIPHQYGNGASPFVTTQSAGDALRAEPNNGSPSAAISGRLSCLVAVEKVR